MAQRLCSAGAFAAVVLMAGTGVAQEVAPSRSVWVVPKFGFLAGGAGSFAPKCSGPGCAGGSQPTAYFDDGSSVGAGVDVLATVTRNLRLGGGLMWDPSAQAKVQGFSESLGTDLSWNGVIEGVLPASDQVSFVAHGQLGVLVLFPGDDLKSTIDATRHTCGGACTVDGGPYKSFTFGFGIAAIARISSRIAFRSDLLFQHYTSMNLVTVDGGGTEQSTNMSGHRIWMLVGLELGL